MKQTITYLKLSSALWLLSVTLGATSLAAETAATASVSQTTTTSQSAVCSRLFQLAFDDKQNLKSVAYTKFSAEGVEINGASLFNELTALMSANQFGSPTYQVTDFFLKYYAPLFDLTRTVSASQTSLATNKMPQALQDIQALLYGENGLRSKIAQLQATVDNDSFFLSAKKKQKLIREVADELKTCKSAILGCSLTLPETLKTFENEYQLTNTVYHIITDQIQVLNGLSARLSQSDVGSSESNIKMAQVIEKKISELGVLRLTLEAILKDTENLMTTVAGVMSDSQQVNSMALRKAVIDASAKGVDVSDILVDKATEVITEELKHLDASEVSERLSFLVRMKNPTEKLDKIYNFLFSLSPGSLTLEHFELLVKMTPRDVNWVILNSTRLSEALKAVINNAWAVNDDPVDILIFLKALRLMKKTSEKTRLFRSITDIQDYIDIRLKDKKEGYVVDVKLLFNAEAKKVLK